MSPYSAVGWGDASAQRRPSLSLIQDPCVRPARRFLPVSFSLPASQTCNSIMVSHMKQLISHPFEQMEPLFQFGDRRRSWTLPSWAAQMTSSANWESWACVVAPCRQLFGHRCPTLCSAGDEDCFFLWGKCIHSTLSEVIYRHFQPLPAIWLYRVVMLGCRAGVLSYY